jgi:hypothetical protein
MNKIRVSTAHKMLMLFALAFSTFCLLAEAVHLVR